MSHDLYTTHADVIEAVIQLTCRRHRLPADHAEELASIVRLKLVERDGEVLRRFQGRSSLRTYLVAVVERVLLDWRTAQWGKWRPSMDARRLGAVAVELDRLLTRDGIAFEAAVEVLRSRGVTATRAELAAMAAKLPSRTGRRFVSAAALDSMPAREASPDGGMVGEERRERAHRAAHALARGLAALPPQDRLILRLRYQDGIAVARIAELLGEEAKPLYRRFERLLHDLRLRLHADGVTAAQVADLLGQGEVEFLPAFAEHEGNRASRPSTRPTNGEGHA